MPDDAAEFDDEADHCERFGSPPLPDDRLWRHPSEVGDRHRWLPSQPSRPGLLSAGLAGALLATGLVLVGTHLATALSSSGGSSSPHLTVVTTPDVTHGAKNRPTAKTTSTTAPTSTTVDPALMHVASTIAGATVLLTSVGSEDNGGAGLLVGSDCIVITSASLVQDGEDLTLTLPSGRQVPGQVVGVDTSTGVAVVRCSVSGLSTIPNDPEAVTPDEIVALVVKDPRLELRIGRVRASDQRVTPDGTSPLLDAIETDIPEAENGRIDEGAAVVDGDGEVVGIVTGSEQGASLATPTWLAMAVANQIAQNGRVIHGFLGIYGQSVTDGGQPAGVKVTVVDPRSTAARAGIEPGDVIRTINGSTTADMSALQARLYVLAPGQSIVLGFERGKRAVTATALLDQSPAA